MALLTRTELEALAAAGEGQHVSIYLPTHRTGNEIQEDPILLKDLLAKAEDQLIASGMRRPDARNILAPATDLALDPLFWRRQSDGLALYLSHGDFRGYRLPYPFQQLVEVTRYYAVKALLPALSGDSQFYVLAVTEGGVRLYQGSKYAISQADLRGAPENFRELLQYEVPQKSVEFHTVGPAGVGGARAPVMFHGQGAAERDTLDHTLEYFREINRAVQHLLGETTAPLILAGIDRWQGLYREANTHQRLLPQRIAKDLKLVSDGELHQLAWDIVAPIFRKEQEDAAGLYRQLAGDKSPQAVKGLQEIVVGSRAGRVAVLWATKGLRSWGTVSQDGQTVNLHSQEEPGDLDLVDVAAVQTMIDKGTVYVVEPNEMPSACDMAALMRY